ncbi:hypothetical protein SAMN05519103_08666 [Rhizobiales bacterium GAS113]|nr:hypothetical protein SAMN05519103_08666 [Rhizobiales bacterium GAS113]
MEFPIDLQGRSARSIAALGLGDARTRLTQAQPSPGIVSFSILLSRR